VQMHPRAKKKFWGVIYRGKLQVHPHAEQEVKFGRKFSLGGESWRLEVGNLAVVYPVY